MVLFVIGDRVRAPALPFLRLSVQEGARLSKYVGLLGLLVQERVQEAPDFAQREMRPESMKRRGTCVGRRSAIQLLLSEGLIRG